MANPASDPAARQERSASAAPSSVSTAGARETVDRSGPAAERVDEIVQDIRAGLARISARELELRQRERDFGQQYHDLREEARRAAEEEFEQANQRLAQQSAELNAQAVDIAARRARLNELTETLRARQLEIEQQRGELARQTLQSRQRAEGLKSWEERQQALLKERVEAVRRQEDELKKRIRLAHRDVTRRRGEVEQRQADLDARAASVEEAEQAFEQRCRGLEAQLSRGELLAGEVEQHHGRVSEERERLARQRGELDRATQEVESERRQAQQGWGQLEAASVELEAERNRLREGRAKLRKDREEFEAERIRLVDEREQLRQAADELDASRAAQARQRDEHAQAQAQVGAARGELVLEGEQLEQARRELDTRRNELSERQLELDQRWQETRQQRHDAARQLEELDARRRLFEQEQQTFQERVERLAQREAQFSQKATLLEADKQRLASLETELSRQKSAAEDARGRTEQVEQQARQRHDELLAQREQAEARENEARQAALLLEVERQSLEGAQAARALADDELDSRREMQEQEFRQGRAELDQRAERLRRAEQSLVSAPRSWPLRGLALALLAATASGAAWFVSHPPLYRATARLDIGSANAVVAEVTSAHRRQLLDPRLLDQADADAELAGAWRAACNESRVAVRAAEDEPVLWVGVTASDAELADRLARTAAAVHVRRVSVGGAHSGSPPGYDELVSRRGALDASLDGLRRQREADEQTLADAGDVAKRENLSGAADRLQADLNQTLATLNERRADLAAMVAAPVPRGNVDPAQAREMLARDAIFQEDRREFRAIALEYRTELAVAMTQLVVPAEGIGRVLSEFAAAISEQRGLDPPVEIGAVLESCDADIAGLREKYGPFVEQWRESLTAVEELELGDEVVTLVTRQTEAADAARRSADMLVALVDEIGARIEGLTHEGDGGTRQVVVAAILRSEHAALAAATESFLLAAAKTAPSENFELDARDRKLRGLRMRLDNRGQAVAQQLQLQADQDARERHAAGVDDASALVRQLERRREDMVTGLVDTLQGLRRVYEAVRRRDEVEVRVQRRAAEIAWLETRRTELEQEMQALLDAVPRPDVVTVAEPAVQPLREHLYRDTGLAAAAGFAGMWLVCGLMIAGGKTRRPNGSPSPPVGTEQVQAPTGPDQS